MLDRDPYIVIDEGRLFWIQDAYTVTGNFPYSQKIGDINYFTKMGVFMTPGLVIDGKVISTGKVPGADQIKKKLQERL